MMENEEREELEKELENLKLLFEFHTGLKVIQNSKEYDEHVNAILDRVNEIKKRLEKE